MPYDPELRCNVCGAKIASGDRYRYFYQVYACEDCENRFILWVNSILKDPGMRPLDDLKVIRKFLGGRWSWAKD